MRPKEGLSRITLQGCRIDQRVTAEGFGGAFANVGTAQANVVESSGFAGGIRVLFLHTTGNRGPQSRAAKLRQEGF